jgi:hypothetical protein
MLILFTNHCIARSVCIPLSCAVHYYYEYLQHRLFVDTVLDMPTTAATTANEDIMTLLLLLLHSSM